MTRYATRINSYAEGATYSVLVEISDQDEAILIARREARPHSSFGWSLPGNDMYEYVPVDASYAHRWVKSGGIHETALYVDADDRVRRAEDCNA